MKDKQSIPSPVVSLLPIAILVVMLFFTIRMLGTDAMGGASQICLLTAGGVSVLIGMAFYGIKWLQFQDAIVENIAGTTPALIILLIIGALSGVWMLSGVVPTLIYYGSQLISPRFFLLSACVICAVVSVLIGSSWTTIATIGIALLGIGKAQGFSEGWIAGAIISGAYFGDKISPLSDTTVLASSVSGTPLFTHIRYMMLTTIPSLCIALVVFTIYGLTYTRSAEAATMDSFEAALASRFNISLWLMIVPILTGVMIARKVPSIITLFVSAVLAEVFMLIFQPDVVREVAGDGVSGGEVWLKGALLSLSTSTSLSTDNAALAELISTRGMAGMIETVWLILCAMIFGGAIKAGGTIAGITRLFTHLARRRTSMVASTVGGGLFVNLCTADQYISVILTCNMFKNIYEKNGYESRLLSRTTEDSVTVTSVLIPWNTCGLTQATVLGVPTLIYLPYCVFNYVSPLMSMFVAATGYKIFKRETQVEGGTESAEDLRAQPLEQANDL